MAFAYTITGTKNLGGAKMIYGTWDGASVTSGTITWGGAAITAAPSGGQTQRVIDAQVTNSVSAANTTFWKCTGTGTLVLGCASNDQGFWSVTVA